MRIILLFALLLSTNIIHGQNYLMDVGQSGFHISGLFSTVDGGANVYGVSPGYTWNGRLSANLNYSRQSIPTFIGDITANSVGPSISYLIIKQQASTIPLSVMGQASYTNTTVTGGDGSVGATNFGVGLFHTITASETVDIVPGFGFNYTNISSNGFSEDDTFFQAVVSVKIGEFYLQPAISFNEDGNQMTYGLGYIF